MNSPNLNQLMHLALAHWKVHRPSLYRELQEQRRLQQNARTAASQTLSDLTSLTASGLTPEEAWERVRGRYLLLPPEHLVTSQNDLTDIAQDLMSILRETEID